MRAEVREVRFTFFFYLEMSICVFKHPPDEGMPGLVVGDDLFLRRAEDVRLLLRSGDHTLNRVLQIVRFHLNRNSKKSIFPPIPI
jgi:hypothetical protein